MSDVTSGSAVAESPAPAAASTPVESAAPSSSATPAENTKPTSFRDAWARAGEAATPDPVSQTPPAVTADAPTTEAPATEPVETAAATPKVEHKKGPIPFERHEAALKNARATTEKEVESRFRETHSDSLKFGQAFEQNPVAATGKLIASLAQHPDYGQAMRAELARHTTRPAASEPAEEAPAPDFQGPDGATFYSASQQAKREAWFRQELLKEVKASLIDPLDQKVAPVLSKEAQREQAERVAAIEKEIDGQMATVFNRFKDRPYFTEHKTAIGTKTLELMKEGHDPSAALALAYTDIVLTHGIADRQQQLTAAAVAKATGSTVQPGSVASAPAKRPRTFRDAFAGLS